MTTGTLFVVATPIGNLKDITFRAVDTLKACPVVAAEDTRRTRALLAALGIAGKRVVSVHAHSGEREVQGVVSHLAEGEDVALVTDAGTPLVSDPGSALVRAAIDAGAKVVPIPGASAVLAALVASGFATDGGFRFAGFLPREGTRRHEAVARLAAAPEPVVLFESPVRVAATLTDLAAVMPLRPACVLRELTKTYEEATRGALRELAALEQEWRGEISVVLGPYAPEMRDAVSDDDVDQRIRDELARGMHARSVAERVAAWSGRSRRDVYARVLSLKKP